MTDADETSRLHRLDADVRLILYRLERIEDATTVAAAWRRQVSAALVVALSIPIVQLALTLFLEGNHH